MIKRKKYGGKRMTANLRQRRAEIDEIDQQLLHLLNRRARLAEEIGQLKRTHNLPVVDGNREALVLQRVRHQNQGPLDTRGVATIFRRIIRESRRLQGSPATRDFGVAGAEEPRA
jgi:chorismate mutase/prephenate dehydratase